MLVGDVASGVGSVFTAFIAHLGAADNTTGELLFAVGSSLTAPNLGLLAGTGLLLLRAAIRLRMSPSTLPSDPRLGVGGGLSSGTSLGKLGMRWRGTGTGGVHGWEGEGGGEEKELLDLVDTGLGSGGGGRAVASTLRLFRTRSGFSSDKHTSHHNSYYEHQL